MTARHPFYDSDAMWPLHEALSYVAEMATNGDYDQAVVNFVDAAARGRIELRGRTSRAQPFRGLMPREFFMECGLENLDQLVEATRADEYVWRAERWYDIEVKREQVTAVWPPRRKKNWRLSPTTCVFTLAACAVQHETGLPQSARELVRKAADIAQRLGLEEANSIDESNSALRDLAGKILQTIEQVDRLRS
jgi:hypothetical protein